MPAFPATESTLSAAHLNAFLRAKYSVSESSTCRLFRTGINHLYVVTDGETRFVFRVYTHGWRSACEVAEEVRLLLHLYGAGVPVSYPVPDADGQYVQTFEAIEGVRFGVLYSFAPGRKVPLFDTQYAYGVGRAMGAMHVHTSQMALQRTVYNYDTLVLQPL